MIGIIQAAAALAVFFLGAAPAHSQVDWGYIDAALYNYDSYYNSRDGDGVNNGKTCSE
eukprot:gene27459-32233_t